MTRWGIGLALCLLALGRAGSQEAAKPAVDPTTGIVHSRRLASGVPLGGIGAGTFQLLTDGTISRARVMSHRSPPSGDLPACFAALWMQEGQRTTAHVLALTSAYSLPTVRGLDYDGLFPQATLAYMETDQPLNIALQAFSPLIPHDLRNTSFPAAAFVFRVKNRSSAPIDFSIAVSWEALSGMGSTTAQGGISDRTGSRVAVLPGAEGYFGLRFTGPSTGTSAAFPQNSATGELTLLTAPTRPQATVTTAGWNALEARPAWWDAFAREGAVSGDAPVGQEGMAHPAGVVAVRMTLRPGDSVEVPFAIAWNAPPAPAQTGTNDGLYYQRLFPDSTVAARALLSEWRSLLTLTQEWQDRLLTSNLPRWLSRRLINSATPLFTHSLHAREGRFTLLDVVSAAMPPDKEKEGAQPVPLSDRREVIGTSATLRERAAAGDLLLCFFPHLEARALAQFAATQTEQGLFPRNATEAAHLSATALASTSPGEPHALTPDDVDDVTEFALQLARYVAWTGDLAFLEQYLPNARRALAAVLQQVDANGLPATTPSLTAETVQRWLAALRATRKLTALAVTKGLTPPAPAETSEPFAGFIHTYLEWNAMRQLVSMCDSVFDRAVKSLPMWFPGVVFDTERMADDYRLFAALLPETALTIAQRQSEGGMAQLQQREEARDNVLRSPFLTPPGFRPDSATGASASLASLEHAADWNALHALEGFALDVPSGALTLSPRLPGTWRRLIAPVFAPTFWGQLEYKPLARGSVLTFRLDRLFTLRPTTPRRKFSGGPELVVRSLRVPDVSPRPTNAGAPRARVSIGQKPLGCVTTREASEELLITLDSPLTMNAGDRLEIVVQE